MSRSGERGPERGLVSVLEIPLIDDGRAHLVRILLRDPAEVGPQTSLTFSARGPLGPWPRSKVTA